MTNQNIRSSRCKYIVSSDDKEVYLIFGHDTELNKEGDILKGFAINCLGRVYIILEDGAVYFLTEEQLKDYKVKVL